MIIVTQYRERDGERHAQTTLGFSDPLKAIGHMAKVELAFGARVVSVNDNRIELETSMMDFVDTSSFEGPPEELRPLLDLIHYYLLADKDHHEAVFGHAVKTISETKEEGAKTPLFLSLMGPMLVGINRLKVAVMLAAGVTDEDDIEAGMDARIEDLTAAAGLQAEGACSFREALHPN